MLTQEVEWAIEPDYLAVFKPASYRWLLPPLNDPLRRSQMTTSLRRALIFGIVALCELLPGHPRAARAGRTRHRLLFLRGRHFLHFAQRRGFGADGKHAALRILRPRVNRAGVFAFFASISPPAGLVAGVRHGGGCASQRGRAQPAGLVRLEFYEGKLGRLTD